MQKKKQARPGLSRPCLAIGQDCTVDAPQGLSKFRTPPQTQEMCQDTSTIKKMSVAPLLIHMYIQVSLVHYRFPSFPSLKGFTCFVQCLTEDRKADLHKDISLRLGSNATGPTSDIALYFKATCFFLCLGISPVGNPSERT